MDTPGYFYLKSCLKDQYISTNFAQLPQIAKIYRMHASDLKMQYRPMALILPLLLIVALIALSLTQSFSRHASLSIAATVDLAFTIPLLHVLTARRNKNLKYSTALLFTVDLIVAGFIVPKSNQFLLHEIKYWIVPAVECFGIIFFVVQTRKILSGYPESINAGNDFHAVLKFVTGKLLPSRLGPIVTAEVSSFYYGFFFWKNPVYNSGTFSYHKKTGTMALIGVFIFMILVETSVVHLLLAKWSIKAAWALTAISIYTALQAFGIAKSICSRSIQIGDGHIFIPYGILAETCIDLRAIISVEIYNKSNPGDKEVLAYISPLRKIEEPDVILTLAKTHWIEKIHGGKKPFCRLVISVDNKELFLKQVAIASGLGRSKY
jgi:hypothetical protein